MADRPGRRPGGGDRHGRARRGLRPPRHHARFQPRRPGAFPPHRTAGGVQGRAGQGGDRSGALRLLGAVQDPDLPRRRRLLRARQPACPHPGRGLRPAGPHHAPEDHGDAERPHLPVHRSQVRLLPAGSCQEWKTLRQGRAHRLDGRRGRRRADRSLHADRRAGRDQMGAGRRRTGLVQTRLGGGRPAARPTGQRQQHAGRHLGSAGRDDHPAGRLPRPVLPGGLPRSRVGADLLETRPARLGQRPG